MVAPGGSFNQGGTLRGMWKDSKNKENAWQFLNYLFNTVEGAEAMVASRNYYPPLKEFVAKHDFAKDMDPYFGTQTYMRNIIKEMERRSGTGGTRTRICYRP